MAKLVALTGRDGVGKSSIAFRLPPPRWIFPFAAPVKAMVAALGFPIDDKSREVAPDLVPGLTVRHLLRTVGTEWGRNTIHPDWWVWLWRRQVEPYLDRSGLIVVDDLRFENEAAEVRRLGGVVVRIVRPGLVRPVEHPSDADAVVPDAVVVNDSLDTAVLDVDRLISEL